MRYILKFEKFLLFPLGIISIITAIYYFIHKAWWLGIYFIIIWFLISVIGQSLHPALDSHQLANGEQYKESSQSDDNIISRMDSFKLAKAMIPLVWLIGISVTIVGLVHGLRWWLAIPIGIICIFLLPMLFSLIILFPKK